MRTRITLLLALLLAGCGDLSAPDLATGSPVALDTRKPDPYAGQWRGGDLALALSRDTVIVIRGVPVRFYSGEAVLGREQVRASGFTVGDELALYVERFIWPDALEPLLYGKATRRGERLLFAVTDPIETQYVLNH